MHDYKSRYYKLFDALTDIMGIVVKSQRETEEAVIKDRQEMLKFSESGECKIAEDIEENKG